MGKTGRTKIEMLKELISLAEELIRLEKELEYE